MKAVGATGAAATAGGIGILATGSATATSGNLSIGDSAVSTDDGDLTEVNVSLDHKVEWDGFDYPVDAAEYRDVLRVYDSDGKKLGSHVLRDGTDSPVLLNNWSSEGDSSDGWGGPDEHTSGPSTEGYVQAGILWTVLADGPSNPTNGIPNGQPADVNDFGLDNHTDGTVAEYTVELVKIVRLYAEDADGSYTSDDGSTSLRLMGGDDGTIGEVKTTGQFTLKVGNDAAETSGTGSGDSSAS
jgi:hypothetical protein